MQPVAFLILAGLIPGTALAVLVRGLRPATSGIGLPVLACAWAFPCWLVAAGLLSRTTGLSAVSCGVAAVALAVLSVGVLALPSSRRVLRRDHGGWQEAAWAAGALTLGMLTWLPVGLVSWATTWAPLGGTSWYYWGLAQQTAAAGRLPSTSVEFGTVVPFLDDYPLFTTGSAALLVQAVDQATFVRQLLTVVPILSAALGAALLVRVLGAGRVVSLTAVPLTIGTGMAAGKLTAYRPEGFAIGFLLLAVALVVGGLRHRDVGLLAPGVVVAAVLSQVHGIALVTAGVMLVAGAAVVWALDRSRTVALLVAGTGAAVAGGVVLLALVMGGFSGFGHGGGLSDIGGLADPTWEFAQAVRGVSGADPPDRGAMLTQGLQKVYDDDRWWFVGAALLSLVVVLSTRATRRRFGPLAAFVLAALVGLAAPVAVFLLGWDSYVPRRTGASRVVAEASLLLPVIVAGGVGAAALAASSWRPAAGRAVSWVALPLALSLGLLGSWQVAEEQRTDRVEEEDVAALRDLDLPPDAVVLTNGFSEGIISGVTGADGLLEGRAPYTFPDILDRANSLLREAVEFYARPRANRAFLDEHDVDYVVLQRARSLTGAYRFRVPFALNRLREGSAFVEVAATPRVVVFRYFPVD